MLSFFEKLLSLLFKPFLCALFSVESNKMELAETTHKPGFVEELPSHKDIQAEIRDFIKTG